MLTNNQFLLKFLAVIKNQNIYIKFEAIFYYIINRDDFNGT